MRALAIAIAATLVVCSWGLGTSAQAAKEKFTRTKPHVNVGTINAPKCSDEALHLRQDGNAPAAAGAFGALVSADVIQGDQCKGSNARGSTTGPVENARPD
jgi:hypothetical protein